MSKLCRVIALLMLALLQVTARADFPITWRQFQAMTGPEGGQTRYIRDADGDLQRIEARVRGDLLIAVTEEAEGFRLTIGQDLALADIASRGWFSDAESNAFAAVYTELQSRAGNRPQRQAGRFRFLAERDPQFRIKPSVLITLSDQADNEGIDRKQPHPAIPAGRQPLEVIEDTAGLKLVLIPAGEFEMGSRDGSFSQKPAHRVRITKPFFIGQTEVTQGQWKRLMSSTPWSGKEHAKDSEEAAATYVSREDANAFCEAITTLERQKGGLSPNCKYRLPTEAEWEYACRAGTTTHFSFGDNEEQLGEYGWWGGLHGEGNAEREKHAHEVAKKRPSPWGLFDMHGNVWEWCGDFYDENYYQQFEKNTAVDPSGPASASSGRPDDPDYAIRGGAWMVFSGGCKSASRAPAKGTKKTYGIGFRVVRELE